MALPGAAMGKVPINLKPYQGLKRVTKLGTTPLKVPINLKPYQGLKLSGILREINATESSN